MVVIASQTIPNGLSNFKIIKDGWLQSWSSEKMFGLNTFWQLGFLHTLVEHPTIKPTIN